MQDKTVLNRTNDPIQDSVRRTEDLMLFGRSVIKIRNRIGPKTDSWGSPVNTGTGSEAWPPNNTY